MVAFCATSAEVLGALCGYRLLVGVPIRTLPACVLISMFLAG